MITFRPHYRLSNSSDAPGSRQKHAHAPPPPPTLLVEETFADFGFQTPVSHHN